MGISEDRNWFESVETIVYDPLRFKAKLAIGEDAYTTLRMKNYVFELWDAAGVASAAATMARSSLVATKFFAPTGVLASLGIGAAGTPVGWVIAAGIIAGGGWVGITRYIKQSTRDRVTVIPEFINTPIDVLALGLFDLMAPLALKVASIDGSIDASEKTVISSYFVTQWGYGSEFVREGMAFTEQRLSGFSIKGVAQSFGEFAMQNKDCNFKAMVKEIIRFLHEIAFADGRIDEREEMAIDKISSVFDEVAQFNPRKRLREIFFRLEYSCGFLWGKVLSLRKKQVVR